MARIVRKQKPPEQTDFRKYKRYLRIDFEKRCAYCHIPEVRFGSPGNYHVEHFRPKSRPEFAHLIHQYQNLYYACADCNRHKSTTWPQPELQALGFFFLDPCEVDFLDHWRINADGWIEPSSHAAEYTTAKINLNRAFLVEWRAQKSKYQSLRRRMADKLDALPEEHEVYAECREALEWIDQKLAEYGDWW